MVKLMLMLCALAVVQAADDAAGPPVAWDQASILAFVRDGALDPQRRANLHDMMLRACGDALEGKEVAREYRKLVHVDFLTSYYRSYKDILGDVRANPGSNEDMDENEARSAWLRDVNRHVGRMGDNLWNARAFVASCKYFGGDTAFHPNPRDYPDTEYRSLLEQEKEWIKEWAVGFAQAIHQDDWRTMVQKYSYSAATGVIDGDEMIAKEIAIYRADRDGFAKLADSLAEPDHRGYVASFWKAGSWPEASICLKPRRSNKDPGWNIVRLVLVHARRRVGIANIQ